ncbi:unnamed protein product [Adineta ricciae]|uniref:ADP ribosyltransferase domain-containing protein n=1 Tax=Adineta ricciae TaxID=249248 RepID=A0A814I1E7_ADIRI|nr:unnamed protein product [Adineta ricciae]CAF1027323.1 unnamed protein product [Adineta ricciae]
MASRQRLSGENFNYLESYILIWLGENAQFTETMLKIQPEVQSIINCHKVFHDIIKCLSFIQDIKDEEIIIVADDQLGTQLLRLVNESHQINTVYICYTDNIPTVEESTVHEHTKIIVTPIADLAKKLSVDHQVRQNYEDSMAYSFVNKSQSSINPNTPNCSFMVFELLIDIILLAQHTAAMTDIINLCADEYKDNEIEKRRIDEFREKYTPATSIHWYTRDSFVYRILNKALRVQNIDVLVAFRFIIKDIHEQLSKLQQAQNANSIKVYRGQCIKRAQVQEMESNIGGIISFHHFLSTTLRRSKALEFIPGSLADPNLVYVLLEIECDQSPSLSVLPKPFANVSKLSSMLSEREVLFALGSRFQICTVDYNEKDQHYVIKLQLVTNDLPLSSVENSSPELDELEKHTRMYKSVLEKLSSTESDVMIYIVAGNGACQQKNFPLALRYLHKAILIHCSIQSRNDRLTDLILAYICRIYCEQDECDFLGRFATETFADDKRLRHVLNIAKSLTDWHSVLESYVELLERERRYVPHGFTPLSALGRYRYMEDMRLYDSQRELTILHYQKILSIYGKSGMMDQKVYYQLRKKLDELLRQEP